MTRFNRVTSFAARLWRPVREHARKLIPTRSVRWTVLYVPGFTLALLFAIKTFGGMEDLFAYVMEAGTRSVPVLIAIAITYGVATGLDWNIDNTYRRKLQEQLRTGAIVEQRGAFLILAGETVAILSLLVVILLAMLVWQG